jgi:hypothetical protein
MPVVSFVCILPSFPSTQVVFPWVETTDMCPFAAGASVSDDTIISQLVAAERDVSDNCDFGLFAVPLTFDRGSDCTALCRFKGLLAADIFEAWDDCLASMLKGTLSSSSSSSELELECLEQVLECLANKG